MRVEMYKCRFTGQLFELKDKKEYIKHLKEVRKQLKDAREEKRIRDTFDQWLKKEKETITHIDMIVPWILKNQRFLIKSYSALKYSGPWSHEKMYPVSDEFVDLTLTASYDPLVSNSHSCPHNGVTNWGGMNKGAPRGYPWLERYYSWKTEQAQEKHGFLSCF